MTVPDRNSVFWWIYVVLLAAVALFIAHSFVGILVLGLFGYYATRPIRTRFERVIDSDGLAAALTVSIVLIPILLLTLYAGIRMLQQLRRLFDESAVSMLTSRIFGLDTVPSAENLSPEALLRDPPSVSELTDLLTGAAVQQGIQVLDVAFGTLMLIALAVTLSYALLASDDRISAAFVELIDGPDATVYAYARAVDSDLESVFFGNFLFVLVMAVVATVTYGVTNLVAPAGLRVPMVFTLGVLTGITSLLPIIVGKVIYLPVVAYLGVTATRQGAGASAFVGGVLIAYFIVLDIVPQSFLQPYISGRQLNPMLLLFAYILGPILFGWYGFFLLPILFVLMLELVRIVLPELLHGDPLVPRPQLAEGTGASSKEMQQDSPPDEAEPAGDPS